MRAQRQARGRGGAAEATGHSPIGGWSVAAMLVVRAGMVGTGLILDPEDDINTDPLAHLVTPMITGRRSGPWPIAVRHRRSGG